MVEAIKDQIQTHSEQFLVQMESQLQWSQRLTGYYTLKCLTLLAHGIFLNYFFVNLTNLMQFRKDVRNAVESAVKVQQSWWKRGSHNRAQIIYNLAEKLQARESHFAR